jgi:hypothetical protein
MLAAVMSPLNRAQNFESNCHQNFGFSMTLRSLARYLEFTPLTGYSSNPYGEFDWCLLHHKVSSLSLCCHSHPYVSCSCSKDVYEIVSAISQNS